MRLCARSLHLAYPAEAAVEWHIRNFLQISKAPPSLFSRW